MRSRPRYVGVLIGLEPPDPARSARHVLVVWAFVVGFSLTLGLWAVLP